jgi:ATP-dependent Lon protease
MSKQLIDKINKYENDTNTISNDTNAINNNTNNKSYYNTRKSNKNINFIYNNENDESEDENDSDYTDSDDYDDNEIQISYKEKKIQIYNYIKKYINNNTNTINITKTKTNNNIPKNNTKLIHKIKEDTYKFYDYLIINQPHLTIENIKLHINCFINYTPEQKTQLLNSFTTIINITDIKIPKLFKIMNSTLDTYYKKLALNKLQLLEQMKIGDNEYFKLNNWLDTLIEIPFNIYKTPKYLDKENLNNPLNYINEAQKHMDKVIYGQQKTKTHIIEILAKMINNPKTLGSVFAIQGEAGTGKTTLIKDGLSEVFGLPFVFISLGGAQDRTFLSGSNYVYEGSNCGKIIQSLKHSQCMNPIFYFDELDKVSTTDRGQEIINLLVHLTDYTQNNQFMDDYMDGIVIDLSRATFIFSFNDKSKISPILLDRMELIQFNSYTLIEKKYIATHFLLPSIIKNIFGENNNKKINLTDTMLDKIIQIPNSFDTSNTSNTSRPIINTINNNTIKNNSIKKKKINITNHSIIKTSNYNNCKYHKNNINKNFLRQLLLKNNSSNNSSNNSNNSSNKSISNKYGGVRYIKKRIEKIILKLNLDIIIGNIKLVENKKEINIDDKYIEEIL